LAGAGIKGLQAILAGTGWGLAVVAIGAVVGVIYSLVTAQSKARGETNALIGSLASLAAARSSDFKVKLEESRQQIKSDQIALDLLKKQQSANQTAGSGQSRFAREGVMASGQAYAQNAAAQKTLNIEISTNNKLVAESEAIYKTANEAAQQTADIAKGLATGTASVAKGIKKTGDAAKAAEDPLKKYRDALADMVEQGKKIGMTSEQIKAFDVEKLALEAAAAARIKYKNASQQGSGNVIANEIRQQGMLNALNQYAAEIRENLSNKLKDYAKSVADASKAHSETIAALKTEGALLGLVGVEREKAALALEQEAYVLKYGKTAWEEYHKARTSNINAKSVIDKDIEALKTLVNNLETAAGMIGGKSGRALQGILKTEITMKDGETQKISEAIASTFPKLGAALSAALAGAQIGTAVDDVFKAVGIKSSKAGAQVGGAIGMAAFGPIGAIAGSILGGIVGGMLKKVKTGSVTLNQIAGGVMERTLAGNSAQLKGIADKMATGLLSGLGDIAEQLGGTLGGNVKVSLGQRKKDFVVDPTGMGRTKGSGVMNFGEDQAAAVAYVTQLAIQQGIITGISAGAQALIKAGSDLNAQVAKALKFDQVFKDLKKESDPLGASLDDLSAEMAKLKVIFDEAGASAEDYGKLEELFAIRQAKAIFDNAKPRRELEIQLMEAQGDAVGALAAQRALELESMDAGLRGLQKQVYAAQDAAKATDALAEAQSKAAEEATQLAKDLLSIARDRRSLEIQLMEAQGDAVKALTARRALELEGIDASLRALQAQIYAAEDAKVASEAAAEAAKVASEATAEAAKIAAETQAQALQAAADITNQRRELEIQLMEAQGMAVEALTARRALELAGMDESLRGLQQQIYAAKAKAEADALAAKAAEEDATAQTKAAKDASDAMQQYADALSNVSKTVVDEINRLRGITTSTSSVLLKAQFATITAQARNGNLDALGKLPELSKSIEEATLSSATSALEVARIRAWLASSLSETLALQSDGNANVTTTGAGMIFDGNQMGMVNNSAQTADGISNMRNEMYNALYQVAKNTGKSYELLDRWDGDGLPDIREAASDYY
jgi:hypothetical protein